ncbi:hypothetical protein QVD17_01449 [Tagetes erecta]|uniref:Gnk2-homologous domain-containing protein n=1 Tax=Tagetes erecta TaxID=13708 RepID=A0AAD8L9R9_TARER|nr:hypothetical protein QVD17_01449 [Tagetes erecta]
MERKSLIIVILLQVISLLNDVHLIIAQKPTPGQQVFKCRNNGNFKSDAVVKERDLAFDLLSRRIGKRSPGYDTSSASSIRRSGVLTMGLCPPNIKMEACRECIDNTIPYLSKNCPKQKEGVAWTALAKVTCMVRYADSAFAGNLDMWVWTTFSTPPNQTPGSAADLEKGLNDLANKLKEAAAGGDVQKKFASGNVGYGPGKRNLYGYMQCTPDIGKEMCMKCLSDATNTIHNCCSKQRKMSGRALSPNCYFWYAHYDLST